MIVMMAVAAVSAAFGLKRSLYFNKISSEAAEHIFDHMVWPNAKNLVLNFRGQVSIPQMPGEARKLIGIFMSDFDDGLWSGVNLQPPPIVELQAISIRHRNGFRKVEQDIFALVSRHADATAMARVKIERQRASGLFLWPMSGRPMNTSAVYLHNQYMK